MFDVSSDSKADAVYIKFTDEPIGYTKELDDNRLIDISMSTGNPVGIDLSSVSKGVKTNDLPEVDAVERILKGLGIGTYTSNK